MKDNNLGEKIKKYRKRAGMSQMDLELAIDAAHGSISRMESGKVNPSKETLAQLVVALNLNQIQATKLYGIDPLPTYINIIKAISKSINVNDRKKLFQNSVDDLVYQLNLMSAFIVIIEGDHIRSMASTNNLVTRLSLKVLGKDFDSFTAPMDDGSNLMVRTITTGIPQTSGDLKRYIVPAVGMKMAIILEKLASIKSGISVPVRTKKEILGAIMFGSREETDFEDIKGILLEYGLILGNALQRLK